MSKENVQASESFVKSDNIMDGPSGNGENDKTSGSPAAEALLQVALANIWAGKHAQYLECITALRTQKTVA